MPISGTIFHEQALGPMMTSEKKDKLVMDATEVARAVTRIAHEILERNKGTENLALVGIRTGGVYLAHRLLKRMFEIEHVQVPTGNSTSRSTETTCRCARINRFSAKQPSRSISQV